MKRKSVSETPVAAATDPLAENEQAFLTKIQLAERLQVSVGTISNWTNAGHLPVIATPGRAVRFHWPTVRETLLRTQRVAA